MYDQGRADALYKFAGDIDPELLERIFANARPGDVISHDTIVGDLAQRSLKAVPVYAAVSNHSKRLSGSPINHTSMYVGRGADGRHLLAEFDETGFGIKPIQDIADHQRLVVQRPEGVTAQQAEAAAQYMRDLAASGKGKYSFRNLLAAVPSAYAWDVARNKPNHPLQKGFDRVADVVGRTVGQNCDPTTSICSHGAILAYDKPLGGRENAIKALTGERIDPVKAQYAVSPARLSASPTMSTLGEYVPANSAGRGFMGALRGTGRNIAARIPFMRKNPAPILGRR